MSTVYVQRVAGKVVGVYATAQPGIAEEVLAETAPDVQTFKVPPVPVVVEMAQARLALLQAGLLDTVEQAIAAGTGPAGRAAQIEWQFRARVSRSSPIVVSLAKSLGLTAQQLDNLFTAAAAL